MNAEHDESLQIEIKKSYDKEIVKNQN